MKVYKIKKGSHYSRPRGVGVWLRTREFEFDFVLDASCWYRAGTIPIEGISKIAGVSFGIHAERPFGRWPLIRNIVNSCVLGFQPDYTKENKFLLYAINDNRGVETRPLFSYCEAGVKYTCKIVRGNGEVKINVGSTYCTLPMATPAFGYKVGFYHGGRSAAPQEMHILLDWKC